MSKFEDDFFQDLGSSLERTKGQFAKYIKSLETQKAEYQEGFLENQAAAEALKAKFDSLKGKFDGLKLENESLQIKLAATQKDLAESKKNTEQVNLADPIVLGKKVYGLVDLKKRMDEAIFDATKYFDKKCPYCGKNLFQGGIRDKIEIDHFFPISRGGQDFPWNVLPICKDCNRRKRDKMPSEYLDQDRYRSCLEYLQGVKQSAASRLEFDDIAFELIRNLFKERKNEMRRLRTIEPLGEIYLLFYPDERDSLGQELELKKDEMGLLKQFFETVSRAPITRHSEFWPTKNEIRICLGDSYKDYCKMDRGRSISLSDVRRVLRNIPSAILSENKVVAMKGKSKRCIIIDYNALSPEWRAVFAEYFGEAITNR